MLVWFLLAGWFYGASLLITDYNREVNRLGTAQRKIQKGLSEKESAFFTFANAYRQQLDTSRRKGRVFPPMRRDKPLPFLLYVYTVKNQQATLRYWSSNLVMVQPAQALNLPTQGTLLQTGNGYYEWMHATYPQGNQKVVLVGLIPIYQQFFIENRRLNSGFIGFSGINPAFQLSKTPNPYKILGVHKQPLFYLEKTQVSQKVSTRIFPILLQFISLLCIIGLVNRISRWFMKQGAVGIATAVFLGGLFTVSVLLAVTNFPVNFNAIEALFPAGIKSDRLQILAIVRWSIVLAWLASFYLINHERLVRFERSKLGSRIWCFLLAHAIVSAFLHLYVIESIAKLFLNDAISFQLSNVFSLNSSTIVAFTCIFLFSVAHFCFFLSFYKRWHFHKPNNRIFYLIATVGSGMALLSIPKLFSEVNLLMCSLLWVPLASCTLYRFVARFTVFSTGVAVTGLFVYALGFSALLLGLSDRSLQKELYVFAKNRLVHYDQTSNYLLRIGSVSAKRVNWQSFAEHSVDSTTSQNMRDSVVRRYFGGYLTKYRTEVYVFRNGKAWFNRDNQSESSLSTLFEKSPQDATYPWLATFAESKDRFGYIMQYRPSSELKIFIIIQSISDNVSLFDPELFRQLQDFNNDLPRGFSYAWYDHGQLMEQVQQYPFPSKLKFDVRTMPPFFYTQKGSYEEIWMSAGPERVLVVSKGRDLFLTMVTTVAYVFASFLAFYFLLFPLFVIINRRLSSRFVLEWPVMNMQNRLRLIFIIFLMVAFVIISVISINYLNAEFKKSNEAKLAKMMEFATAIFSEQLQAPNFNFRSNSFNLNPSILNLAKQQNLDVNLFNANGELKATTQDILFKKQIISTQMNSDAFQKLCSGEIHRLIQPESIGDLKFVSIYQPLKMDAGKVLGFIQIPYFSSQFELRKQISDFLIILINVIAFVFLISGAVALVVSSGVTKSITLIADKMNALRISGKNERIQWNRQDEVAPLVQRYNEMVNQLESSVQKLALAERENGWKDMARQVAHEIRNPLTPIKLNLQFLQKAIHEKYANTNEIALRVSESIVDQIEHLSRIASDFHLFANIGQIKPECFSFNDMFGQLVGLYNTHQGIQVHYYPTDTSVWMHADKTQINRLFTNLLQNAIEAFEEGKPGIITTCASYNNKMLTVMVSDNGPGIKEAVSQNVFKPNFTTKTTGTGLGLAMCKTIVENAGGSISFSTVPNEGTVFMVHLPAYTPCVANK